jgi:predicted kinase
LGNSILALVGLPAAGKSTVAQILENDFGFKWVRTRDIVKVFAGDGSIASLQSTGADLKAGAGAEAFCTELFHRLDFNRPAVIDAIRPIEHWLRVKKEYGNRAHLVSVVAPRALRQERFASGDRTDSFQTRDEHEVEADVPALIEESTFTIVNQDYLSFRVKQLVDFANHISTGN